MEQLTFDNPKYEEAVKQGRYLRNIEPEIKLYQSLPTGIVIPRGYLQIVEDSMVGNGLGLSIKDNRVLNSPISLKSNIVLRPYQAQAKFDLFSHPNGMLVAPAASGKTIMGLDVFASVRQNMLWITHTNRLAEQVRERITQVFDIPEKEIGMIGGGKFKVGERITIGMIPTLVRREEQLLEIGRTFGLVIVDEAHHVPASTFLKVLGYFSSYYLYGLTATPYRRDKLEDMMFATIGLGNAVVKRQEVKKKGAIITPKVIKRIVPSTKWGGNDYHQILKDIVMPNVQRLEMIASDVVREANDGNYCIVINTRKAYAEELLVRIAKHIGDKAVIATGDYTKKQNEEQVKKIDAGEASVLITTFELLGEGFDVPRLNRGFLALPFREKARVEQSVGRIQRTCEGKTDAIMYDYVDENVGILKNQFVHRAMTYRWLGMRVHEESDVSGS
jgi:superfamily II DNA or RNA helicase